MGASKEWGKLVETDSITPGGGDVLVSESLAGKVSKRSDSGSFVVSETLLT